MGLTPHEIFRYVYFFVKEENGNIFGTAKSLRYKVSSIPSGGSEILASWTTSIKEKWVIETIEEFVENLYSFEYSDNLYSTDGTNDSDDEENNDYQTATLEMK